MTNPNDPIKNDGTRDTQLTIAARASELATALHRFIRDVPMPVDTATGNDLFPDQVQTDIADSLLGAEMTLHSLTGTVIANLGLSSTGVLGHGPDPRNGGSGGQPTRVSAPR